MRIIYEDEDLVVYDKPAGVNSDDIPGRAHRLDKDTSGIILAAKNNATLEYLQKQFKERKVEKKYIALIAGHLKNEGGVGEEDKSSSSTTEALAEVKKRTKFSSPSSSARVIETLLGRSPKDKRKQKVYLPNLPESKGKREAITRYKVLQKFENYDLIEAEPKTGRKHQIRAHFAHLNHPIAGDKLYGFKNQPCPEGLKRQFLHASYLKIEFPNKKTRQFRSELPDDLKKVLKILNAK